MSLRLELTSSLVDNIRKIETSTTVDIKKVIELAFQDHDTLQDIHNAVKNGKEYFEIRGNRYETPFAAKTSLVDMEGKLYLLTDRLLEVVDVLKISTLPEYKTKHYKIRNSNWD